jgi:hypothetical protein
MRYNIAALCVLTLTLGGALLAQEPAPPAAPSLDALVSDLGSDDFTARERATEALRALGEKARDALEGAKDSDNLERRTRVRRLLGDLESADAESDVAGRRGGRLTPVEPDDGRPQRQRVLRPGVPVPIPFPGGGTLDGRVDAYREALRRIIEATPQLGQPGLFGPGLTLEMDSPHGFRQTMRVQRGDESIQSSRLDNGSLKLEVTRTGPTGEPEVEVYEADSVEAFKQEHPGVYER